MLENKKTLLICTKRTAEFFCENKNLSIFSPIYLVDDIEKHKFNLQLVDINKHFNNIKGNFESIILGCTHYNFVKVGIYNHFLPQNFIDGIKNSVNMVKRYKKQEKCCKNKANSVIFIGSNMVENQLIWGLMNKKN